MFKMFIRGLCLGIKIKKKFQNVLEWFFLNGVEVPVFDTYIYRYTSQVCVIKSNSRLSWYIVATPGKNVKRKEKKEEEKEE